MKRRPSLWKTVTEINHGDGIYIGFDRILFRWKPTGAYFMAQYMIDDYVECLWLDEHGDVADYVYFETEEFMEWCNLEVEYFKAERPFSELVFADTKGRVETWQEAALADALQELPVEGDLH